MVVVLWTGVGICGVFFVGVAEKWCLVPCFGQKNVKNGGFLRFFVAFCCFFMCFFVKKGRCVYVLDKKV